MKTKKNGHSATPFQVAFAHASELLEARRLMRILLGRFQLAHPDRRVFHSDALLEVLTSAVKDKQ